MSRNNRGLYRITWLLLGVWLMGQVPEENREATITAVCMLWTPVFFLPELLDHLL